MSPVTGSETGPAAAPESDHPVEIRLLTAGTDVDGVATLFQQVWGTAHPLVGGELLRAIGHSGGYVAGAFERGNLIGASLGFLGRFRGAESLHSHITGILPGLQHSGVGRAIKHHQRHWAADHNIPWITWTFDPLVRRNAHFNFAVLGCEAAEYLPDFYGSMADSINGTDESDRLLVAWATGDEPAATGAAGADVTRVPTPDDIVALRRTDPAAADAWRQRLRVELGEPVNAGAAVTGVDDDGHYLLEHT